MRLLNVFFEQLSLFVDECTQFDLFAEDKVPASDESTFCIAKPMYTNNVLSIAGINATGKTTVLGLLELTINVINGKPLASASSYEGILYRIRTGIGICAVFEQNGEIYVLESQASLLLKPPTNVTQWRDALGFTDESLYHWRKPRKPSKATLSNIDALVGGCELLLERRHMTDRDKSFLSHNVSIATSVTKRDTLCLYQSAFDTHDEVDVSFSGISETLRVFDPSVESLDLKEDGKSCAVFFANGSFALTSVDLLEMYLSSGTIKGLRLIKSAVEVLSSGGYLLVDEIENHLNKQLVNVLIDFFQSSDTNPNGATLVFTTHYPEVLDRIHRKDNVYFLTRDMQTRQVRAIKYSSKVKRIENKKSEVFLSNYIGGTAPRYSDVQALRALVREATSHGTQ
ncbi:MAG: ATP-binding protein [Atopobiaceae bacterium]|nr:ATP-binding protein [Atopobiaceae bacterium]